MHSTDEDITSRRQKYVAGLLIRVIVCGIFSVVFMITAYLLPGSSRSHFGFAIAIFVGLMAINYPFWLIGKRAAFPLEHFYVHWAFDLFLLTVVLHMLGGVELPCGFVGYMIMILTSAVFLSQRASYIVASSSTVCYDAMVIFEGIGLIPAQDQIWDHEYTVAAQVIIVLASNVFFFLFAYLAGSLSEELKRTNAALARAEAELREHNRTLEDSVRRRTLALEEKTHEIEEFVHIVTHDLRNVAIGATEIARRLVYNEGKNLSAKGQRYATNLLEDSRIMNRMLSHLLALFRVDQEHERAEWLDMGELVREIVAGNLRRTEEKGIRIWVGDLPRISADRMQMSHVIANLIDNAIKYSGDKPHPLITVDCVEEKREYRFSVKDNGIGMSPEQTKRVFQMYHRGPDQTVQGVQQEGHGVGLAITKRIVERWGGQIWVESKAGEGSAFYFTWPREQATEREAS